MMDRNWEEGRAKAEEWDEARAFSKRKSTSTTRTAPWSTLPQSQSRAFISLNAAINGSSNVIAVSSCGPIDSQKAHPQHVGNHRQDQKGILRLKRTRKGKNLWQRARRPWRAPGTRQGRIRCRGQRVNCDPSKKKNKNWPSPTRFQHLTEIIKVAKRQPFLIDSWFPIPTWYGQVRRTDRGGGSALTWGVGIKSFASYL